MPLPSSTKSPSVPAAALRAMRALLLGVALLLLGVVLQSMPTAAPAARDIGEEGKRDSQYYKWQRDKEDVAKKAAQAKERQLAREAEAGEGRPKAELSVEEKELQGLRRAITRKEQYKREAIEAENFEEAARLRDEISAAQEELAQRQAAAKAGTDEQCEETTEGQAGEEQDDAEAEGMEDEGDEEELSVVGADGIEITAAGEEAEDEDYTSRCPDGYYDHDKDHRSREYHPDAAAFWFTVLTLPLVPQRASRSTTLTLPSSRRWWCTWTISHTSLSTSSQRLPRSFRASTRSSNLCWTVGSWWLYTVTMLNSSHVGLWGKRGRRQRIRVGTYRVMQQTLRAWRQSRQRSR